MRKVWIVVANSTCSKIYRAESVQKLSLHQSFDHKEGALPSKELSADKQGRSTNRGSFGTDTMEEKTTIKDKEAQLFATTIASYLQDAFEKGEFERLYIIAKAPFLGFLKHAINGSLNKSIAQEVQKDLTQATPAELLDYLPPAL